MAASAARPTPVCGADIRPKGAEYYRGGAPRHRSAGEGSGAVNRYTMMEIKDRFDLMNIAFDQEDYRVDKNLEIIDSPVEKDS